MGLLDYSSEININLKKKECFSLILVVLKRLIDFKLESSSESTGYIVVKTKISLFSWGENIRIQLTEINPKQTRIKIMSSPKTGILFGGALDMGKNRNNIDTIINEISKEIKTK
jgi:hypothetical protein